MQIKNINMGIGISGVEDIMWIQYEKCKEDRGIYSKLDTRRFRMWSNDIKPPAKLVAWLFIKF